MVMAGYRLDTSQPEFLTALAARCVASLWSKLPATSAKILAELPGDEALMPALEASGFDVVTPRRASLGPINLSVGPVIASVLAKSPDEVALSLASLLELDIPLDPYQLSVRLTAATGDEVIIRLDPRLMTLETSMAERGDQSLDVDPDELTDRILAAEIQLLAVSWERY